MVEHIYGVWKPNANTVKTPLPGGGGFAERQEKELKPWGGERKEEEYKKTSKKDKTICLAGRKKKGLGEQDG